MSKSYQYRTTFTFEGKRYSIVADTEKELYEKKTNKLRDLKESRVTIGPNMTVKAWAEIALSTYKPNVSKGVMSAMKDRIGKHIYSAIGTMPIRSVKPLHCQAILNAQDGMSYSHIKKLVQELKFIFQTAVDNQIILRNPAQNITPPKGVKGSRRSLTEYETEHFLRVCEQDSRFILFELMYYCGCRPAEAYSIQGMDYDREKKLLHIRGTKTVNSDRSVPVPTALQSRLDKLSPFELAAQNGANKRHTKQSYKRLTEHLRRAMNLSMGARTYRNALVPPLPLAADFVPYCLRHTYCTNLAKSGVDVRTAQRLMGHASIQMTADIYTHVDESQLLDAAEKIEKYDHIQKAKKSGTLP